ncbi:FAD-binding protein [Opitutales bacterium]|nr:FAD-binding protein [Opitutales bacterium]
MNDCTDIANASSKLVELLGNCVEFGEQAREDASYDGLKVSFLPDAVIRVKEAEQVGDVLRIANEHAIPITTRGAGSSLTGGATPIAGGWVLDLSRLNHLDIDESNQLARCGPGVVVADLQSLAAESALFYPPDPSSKKFCTIGGNIACNAGGLRCVKYGVTRDYVLSLAGYLASGEYVEWGRATRKFATGYNVRDLWIGSEGTLGVVTEATLRLVDLPLSTRTFLGVFENDEVALSSPGKLRKLGLRPSILEYLDRWTIDCLQKYVGTDVFPGITPHPMLLIELDGSESQVDEQTKELEGWLKTTALAHRSAHSLEEAEKLWEVRRQGSSSMKKLASTKLNEDVVVPLGKQVELVGAVERLRAVYGIKIGVFGHCGDGNLHVNLMYDEENSEETSRAVSALKELMSKVIELGGAISGEHGVGLAKTPFVREQFNKAEWQAMLAIKEALDPNKILNPGKIFDVFHPWEQKKKSVTLSWEIENKEPKPQEV